MKVVIIGGGIGGLTAGVFLQQRGIDVVIYERAPQMHARGHAFLMHTTALNVLNLLSEEYGVELPGNKLNTFSLNRPDGREIKHQQLNSWKCIKRVDLIDFLHAIFPAEKIRNGRKFTHFLYENGKATAAVFNNGETEYGDVFIGADGSNSKVRELIFGNINFSPVHVKEIVGIAENDTLSASHAGVFTKFQDQEKGLAFGLIPSSENEFVWFMQFDTALADLDNSTPEALEQFCTEQLRNFPEEVQEILRSNDFSTSYIWNTRDFDLLPAFHKENIALIGDAGHLALPFTSAGTTNAILDAQALAKFLAEEATIEDAFTRFYHLRATDIEKHITLGRELKSAFLNPIGQHDDDVPVPLIKEKEAVTDAGKKPIQVLYFTDPICSTCWIIQPLLRKLKLEYDRYLNIEYRMGGLLPSWDEYNKGIIKQPTDAAKHWEEVCACHEIPLDGDIWLEDPLSSSYPPSIAFKAAQMQDTDLAILFLRRIKEMVFLEKKNIIKWEFLETAAFEVGLDSARLKRDFEGQAQERFREDLRLAAEYGVTSFPTLFFSDKKDKQFTIKGYQSYERFEDIINKLIHSVEKDQVNPDPQSLFMHFPTMTSKEFSFLSDLSKEDADKILAKLYDAGKIEKYESKNGVIWISRFSKPN